MQSDRRTSTERGTCVLITGLDTATLTRSVFLQSSRAGVPRVSAHKSNRRSQMMLAALVGIGILADGVGLIIHYGFTFRHAVAHDSPIAHDLASKAAALTHTHAQ
jgi:hypothetical protein